MKSAIARNNPRALMSAMLVLLATLAMQPANALDWRDRSTEPQDAAAAATRSDEYAWRLFVALNWPADLGLRAPDRLARFGAERPVVWETWQSVGDVYMKHGVDPGPWVIGSRPQLIPPERRFEVFSPKDLPNARHIVGGVMVPFQDSIASARRLTEIRMNRSAFDFIRAHQLYSLQGQIRTLKDGAVVSFPFGAKEVKAKWRPIRQSESTRYHTTVVTLPDGTKRLFGLTALHIVSKDLPNWFWATFEHVDNPSLADGEGWQLPSRDSFACHNEAADCNRPPTGIGLEGTVWQYYRLRGTQIRYTNSAGQPQLLANSELEAGMQPTASCMTCHSRAAIGVAGHEAIRLAIFATGDDDASTDAVRRRGFFGEPRAQWFGPDVGGQKGPRYRQLDFVWSMLKAQ